MKIAIFRPISFSRRCLPWLVSLLSVSLLHLPDASACTSILVPTADGSLIYGRTMEFALPLDSDVIAIPRGYEMKGTGPDGTAGGGLIYKTRYAIVGLNGAKLPIIVDGMNEKGLVGGGLYLPSLTEYQETSSADARTSVASYEILAYILATFASVDEIKQNLGKVKVNRAPHPAFKGVVPLHFTLHDASGRSLVVEYIGGELQMTDNVTHVVTNAPAISWHLSNVALYGNLSPAPVAPFMIGSTTFNPPSTGNNLIGLPGDFSSPSRFVRALFFSRFAPQAKTAPEGVNTVFHIMNHFDIPPGAVRTSAASKSGGGLDGYETTEWTTVMDIKNRTLYVRTFDNAQTHRVALGDLDLNGKGITTFPLDAAETAIDLRR